MPRRSPLRPGRTKTRGQSVVEFALVVPVLLLLTLTAIDFGRVFLGWVNLQQMTRIAANQAAEHASAWAPPFDLAEQAKYRQKVENDARLINCDAPDPIPDPVIAGGTQLGAPITVVLSCEFHILTPVISNVIGQTILVSASTTYPVKEGVVATVPGGGAPIVPVPIAKFVGSPQTGWSDLEVTFSNDSTGAPSSQNWDFSVGPAGTGSGTVLPDALSSSAGPQTRTFRCTGTFPDFCTFGVSLRVANAGGTDTETKSDYITVRVPPAPPAPIAEFTGTPRSGIEPRNVAFSFVDLRGGSVTYTQFRWDFTSDGTFDATGPTTSHTYASAGAYDVTLEVTDSSGATNTLTKAAYIVVTDQMCTVPDFARTNRNQAQNRWAAAGFTTQVLFEPGSYSKLGSQSITGGTIDPQPGGCDAVITVGPG